MKKCLSILLAIAMLSPLAALPISASAAEVEVQSVSIAEKAVVISDSKLAEAYDKVKNNVRNHEKSFSVELSFIVNDFTYLNNYLGELSSSLLQKAFEHDGNPIGGDYISNQINRHQYSFSWSSINDKCTATINYNISYFTTKNQEEELNKKVDEILDSLNLDGKSDYDKVCDIYDYLTSNVVYDNAAIEKEAKGDFSDRLPHSSYAALCKGTAVCQGYSTALYRLLLEEGIDCRVIIGKGLKEDHAWNVVKIGDVYYNVDATWDAHRTSYKYFLCSDADFKDHTPNAELLPSYTHASESININTDDKSPAGSSTGQNIQYIIRMFGDIDGDNNITSADSLSVLRFSVGLDELDPISRKLADVNGDGNVDSSDALDILRFSVGLPSTADFIGTYLK